MGPGLVQREGRGRLVQRRGAGLGHSLGASRFSQSSDLASLLGRKLPFCVNLLDMVAA